MAAPRLDDGPGAPARRWRSRKGDAPKEAAAREGLGRSWGGLTTKLHAATDALGNPLRWVLTPGQRNDVTQAGALLAGIETGAVVADKGYDADWLVALVEGSGAEAVIPPKRNRLTPRPYDANLYADRNKVERLLLRRRNGGVDRPRSRSGISSGTPVGVEKIVAADPALTQDGPHHRAL